ncbi:MAG: MmoB/DmpM family protein [Gammaproteobacteria bacterium]|nr:MmoB/DmpM family protein [Gammaproteobacteria bacterium]
MTEATDFMLNNKVGPVIKTGEIADAVIEAVREDNPGKTFVIEDNLAYVRIQTDGECIIRRETMEAILGRPFNMQELGVVLASFAGQIESESTHFRFYLTRTL